MKPTFTIFALGFPAIVLSARLDASSNGLPTSDFNFNARQLQGNAPGECQPQFEEASLCIELDPPCEEVESLFDLDDCASVSNGYLASIQTCYPACSMELGSAVNCLIGAFCPGSPIATPAPTPRPTRRPTRSPTRLPTQAPTPVPAPPNPVAPPSEEGGACFSESATVQVLQKGRVAMKDLLIHDKIFTGKSYEPVYAFGHLDRATSTTFLQIHTTGINSNSEQHLQALEITAMHLLYIVGKSHPVPAGTIQVGDVLQGETDNLQVQSIRAVSRAGLYAPLTPSGRLLVDGILVSSYVALQNTSDGYYYGAGNLMQVPHHTIAHLYMTPFRMACMGISPVLCQAYTGNGMPYYVDYGMQLLTWAGHTNNPLRILFLCFTLCVMLALAVIEAMFFPAVGPLVVFAMLVIGVASGKSKRKEMPSMNQPSAGRHLIE